MSWGVIAFIIVSIFVVIAVILKQKQGDQIQKEKHADCPYVKTDAPFTPAERSFLGVLNQAVNNDAQILGKLRIADIITPRKGLSKSDRQIALNKISKKHFDFVLCDKNDLSILCVIELNDSSHNQKNRQDRDKFVEAACKSANLPFIKIPAQPTYNINEIRNSIAIYIPGGQLKDSTQNPDLEVSEKQSQKNEKICPKCSSEMIIKVAKKGRDIGNEFWGCNAFPQCKYTEAIKGIEGYSSGRKK